MFSIVDTGPFAAPPPAFNMAAYVLEAGRQTPDKIALKVVGKAEDSWTYARLRNAVFGTATGLLEHGAKAGDRVLIRLGNTPDFPVTYLAAIAAGLLPVPLSTQLTEPEVARIIAENRPALILAATVRPPRVVSKA